MSLINTQLIDLINRILAYLYIYLFISGIASIILGILIKTKQKIRIIKKNNYKLIIIKILFLPFIIIKSILMMQPNSKKERINKKIKQAGLNLNFEQYINLKLLTIILISILLLAIYKTNYSYITKEILEKPIRMSYSNYNIINSNKENEDLEKRWQLFKLIKSKFKNYNNILYMEEGQAINEIKEIIINSNQIDEVKATLYANDMYNRILQIESYKYSPYFLLIILSSFWWLDILIFIKKEHRKKILKNDLEIIKNTTYLLGIMENTTVKNILIAIGEVSEAYKPIITKCLNNYNSMENGREKAIMQMADEVDNIQFRKLLNVLKDIANGNKKDAIKNLEEDIKMEEKENLMVSENKIEKKTWIAILIIAPCLLLLGLLLLKPFSNLYEFL